MKAATTFALSALALLPFVSAHGYVSQVTIDGTSYKGNTPGSSSGEYSRSQMLSRPYAHPVDLSFS